jgi:ABC-type proline/glycine betaine transport systems, permease component
MLNYIENNGQEMGMLFLQHVAITFLSLAIAFLIALPLGVLLSRSRVAEALTMPLLSVIYTIPSMALFALLIPVAGLGLKPAIIALVAYGLLIMVRNVVAGFHSIDPAVLEAARGMGLDRWQMFFDIELVLALPVIIGGVRITAVSVIGIATIASWINAGGLGVMLFQGLSQNNVPEILWGTLLVAGLAIGVNYSLAWLEAKALKKAQGEND